MNRRERGFVLVLVLAMLVILSLLAGGIAATTARLAAQSQQRAQRMQDAVDIASTRATVLYLLSTQRMTVGGVTVDRLVSMGSEGVREIQSLQDLESSLPVGNEIAMDARSYRGIGNGVFALQDDYGLFGVNWNPPWMLKRLLDQGGASKGVPAETLINRLLDYQDKDNLYRLNSAEADGYRRAGLRAPTNRPLATPMELMRVLGWAEALAFLSPAEISDNLSSEAVAVVNVNTAPPRVLRTIEGVDEDMAARVVAFRKTQPFLTEVAFFEFLGLPKSAEAPIAVYPAMSGTLKLWPSHGGQVGLVHWTLTPVENGGRPWREDYELIQSQAIASDAVAYPVRSRLFAKPVATQD
ncbi:MAG TPA: type II secretion system protein GspK [Thermomonas sp.]|nr:type II secretion system protein GspK [Thermomonas sp.]